MNSGQLQNSLLLDSGSLERKSTALQIDRLRIIIVEEVGENCVTIANGAKIYQIICPILSVGGAVILDFLGVNIFTGTFFNFAIGQLLRDFQPEFLNQMLSIENLNSSGSNTLESAIENASRFYSKPSKTAIPSIESRADSGLETIHEQCCCQCRYQTPLRKHPWNEGAGKGHMQQVMGWICLGFFQTESEDFAIFNDRGHGMCEMFQKKDTEKCNTHK